MAEIGRERTRYIFAELSKLPVNEDGEIQFHYRTMAEKLKMTQSTLSRGVDSLEKQRLVRRVIRGSRLSPFSVIEMVGKKRAG